MYSHKSNYENTHPDIAPLDQFSVAMIYYIFTKCRMYIAFEVTSHNGNLQPLLITGILTESPATRFLQIQTSCA